MSTYENKNLKKPPGTPIWQLKITRSSGHVNTPAKGYVIIGDSEHKADESLKT